MLLTVASQHRVVFVGGKGGVGKTSVASAVALARAREGANVLLVSTDPAHSVGHLWRREVGDSATALSDTYQSRLQAVEIDPEVTVAHHLAEVRAAMLKMLPPDMHEQAERHLQLARDAPGTLESAVLDRLASIVVDASDAHDLVVVDTAPSGHTLRLLAQPQRLAAWTEMLLANRDRADRFGAAIRGLGGGRPRGTDHDTDAEIRRVLTRRHRLYTAFRDVVFNPQATCFVTVTTPEYLPIAETLEVQQHLAKLGVKMAAVVVNRASPSDSGPLLRARHDRERSHIQVLRAAVQSQPIIELPLLPSDLSGESGMCEMADALATAGS